MNLGLLHPIAQYAFWSFVGIGGPAWILDMTILLKLRSRKFRNEEIIVGLAYFILFIGYLIFSSFAFAFFAFAGRVVNYDFWGSLFLFAIFGWWLFEYVDNFSEVFNTSFKRVFTIFLGIFVLFFLFVALLDY